MVVKWSCAGQELISDKLSLPAAWGYSSYDSHRPRRISRLCAPLDSFAAVAILLKREEDLGL